MGGFVRKPSGAFLCVSMVISVLPSSALSQSGWGEPIAPRPAREPEAAPAQEPAVQPEPPSDSPNPEWADPSPPAREEPSAPNPDWQDDEDEPARLGKTKPRASQSYGLRYASRSLTMPRGMMRGTFDTVVGRLAGDTVSTMNFGAAITLADDFEIGFSRYRMGSFPTMSILPSLGFGAEGLIGFEISPDAKFGDIPFYARFEALDRDVVKLGFDAVFRIPTESNFGFLGGIPLRFVIEERLAIDTGPSFTVDDNPQGPAVWSLELPLKLVANATDHLFIEAASGMTFFDLSHTVRTVTSGLLQGPFYFIPVGLRVGYTVEARATMMDVFAGFRFPTLYGFTTRDSALTTEAWQVTIGVNVYSPILFKGSAL